MAWYSSSLPSSKFGRILEDCQEKALVAASEAIENNYDLTLSYLNSFYDSLPQPPRIYPRTDNLRNALSKEDARIVGNKVKGRVYYDYAGKGYPSYSPRGINPSMFKVIGWIESDSVPCRPVPSSSIWRVPKASFKDNINSAFSKYFHR